MVQELLTSNIVDVLFLTETKIEETFTYTQLIVNGFQFHGEQTGHYTKEALLEYARSDLGCDQDVNLEFQNVESICIALSIDKKKRLISGFIDHHPYLKLSLF